MRITFLPKNLDGSGMYRCWFPAIAVEKHGHSMKAPPMAFYNAQGQQLGLVNGQLPDGWMNCVFGDWPDSDIVVFQMPLEDGVPRLITRLRGQGRKVVVEVDDDFLHLPPYNPFGKGGETARHLFKCIQLADAVTVSTPSLRSSYKHLNNNITVLPNRLHWPMWEGVTPVYEQSWRKTRIGYMGTLDYHSADLDVVKPWLGKWVAAHPEIEFVAAGDPRIHDHLGIPPGQRVATDKTDFRHLELGQITAVMDVGLVPLARNRFNEGKSYLKGLEYSACGIVPLATPTQQYREFVRQGVSGVLCDSKKEWVEALDSLTSGPEARARRTQMGAAARAVAREFTYDNHVDDWINFYQGLGADSVAARTLWTPDPVPAVC